MRRCAISFIGEEQSRHTPERDRPLLECLKLGKKIWHEGLNEWIAKRFKVFRGEVAGGESGRPNHIGRSATRRAVRITHDSLHWRSGGGDYATWMRALRTWRKDSGGRENFSLIIDSSLCHALPFQTTYTQQAMFVRNATKPPYSQSQ